MDLMLIPMTNSINSVQNDYKNITLYTLHYKKTLYSPKNS